MTTAGLTAQDVQVPLKNGFLHHGQSIINSKSCWTNHDDYESAYYDMEPISLTYSLKSPTQHQISSIGHISRPIIMNGHCCSENCMKVPWKKSNFLHLGIPIIEHSSTHYEEDQVVSSFKKLSMNSGSGSEKTPPLTPVKSGPPQFYPSPNSDRSSRPLPPLPISEDHLLDDADSEVEFITSSDTDLLLQDPRTSPFKYGAPSRRSFRGCGQINYAYFESASAKKTADETPTCNQNGRVQSSKPQKPEQPHRRLRRSHSGPAGSYNKATIRIANYANRTSPNSDEDKPEVPPRIPIPPRSLKPDYRRWSAEVSSNTYSDEDRPPKVPPREPLSGSNSRTPSPKSLPSYLNGVMPPTQSFAPDPKYVSSKAFQRQNSEGSSNKVPCILPIMEHGKKASSTHYYLLPERPPYLDRYEKYLTEAKDSETKVQSWSSDGSISPGSPKPDLTVKVDICNNAKRKHLSDVVSP
ncbi:ERBB receptor feedback inhibitor 1 [Pelobates cultripes]|uniref:ERBB receptor feedback inhibitor 1 n=1 Tax=Pelobates cultripes TaxID=61616 RepID=A0AAD1T5Z9_PELCU|nr:ERBB receptor feedback inhibitor 1 [Pelobates cultripes]